jgi:DNA-directed RNA polymerase subunit RPC12/RpoP
MASTIAISCPKCEKQINAPAELEGKKIRCKECRHVFTVKVPPGARAAKPAEPAKAAHAEEEEKNPYVVRDMEFLPRCPYCAKELESEDAVICLNCGYNTRTRERVAFKKTFETTGGDTFVWLLPGILCALGVLWMIGNIVIFWTLFPRWAFEYDANWWSTFFALWARIWFSVVCVFIGFFLGKFAVQRLILNPTPPEKEKKK